MSPFEGVVTTYNTLAQPQSNGGMLGGAGPASVPAPALSPHRDIVGMAWERCRTCLQGFNQDMAVSLPDQQP